MGVVRAVDLARELGIDPKRLRQWLRANFVHERNTPWELTPDQERQARQHFGSDLPGARSPLRAGGRSRSTSDEAYVIDLCDEVLGMPASRQHRFTWLLGDPATSGRRAELPVDAYYPALALVVEYRERQHYEPTPFFDRRQTISGVGRGEQRRRYDARRELEVPQHGIRLVVIPMSALRCDSRGRLVRDLAADRSAIRELLAAANPPN